MRTVVKSRLLIETSIEGFTPKKSRKKEIPLTSDGWGLIKAMVQRTRTRPVYAGARLEKGHATYLIRAE